MQPTEDKSEEIKSRLAAIGYTQHSLITTIMPWLKEKLKISLGDVEVEMSRWELAEMYSNTISRSIVASNAIEGEKVICDEFYSLILYLDFEIRKRFQIITV
jgi:hypothetical protein